jgi:HK97 family phage portal protein
VALADYFQKIFGRNNQALPSPNGTQVGGRIGYPSKAGYLANVEHGFNRNPVVAACVGVYASTLNEPPLAAMYDDGTINRNHPVSLLFRKPNPRMGQAEFWQIVWTYLAISGNAYIVKVRSAMGNIVELYPYSDAHVAPLLNDLGWVYAYRYQSGNITQDWPADDVIHIQNPAYRDPVNMHKGISPISVAWDKINTYNELQATIYSLVASNAVPSGVLSAPGDIPIATVESLKAQLRKRKDASGRERTDPLVLGSGMNYTQMGLDAQKLQAIETIQELETSICGAFRIHPAVVLTSAGLARSTYNNLASAYQEFTTLTRVPFWNALEEQLESGLRKEFPDVQLQFDLGQVQALQPDVDAVIYPVIAEFNANLITLNESRAKLGFEPVEDGDKYSYEVVPQPGGFGAFSAPEPEAKQLKAPYEDIDFSPPQGVRDEAAKGLEWREEYGRGGTEVGVARARDLSNGRNVSPDTARRMASYFARHEIDKQGEGWQPDQDGFPSAGRIAWALWGGDAGQTWANKLVGQMDNEDEREGRASAPIQSVDPIESVEGRKVKWHEPEAVKYWQTQEDVVLKAVESTEADVAEVMKRIERAVMKQVKSKGIKAPEDAINIAELVKQFMAANRGTQDILRAKIIELVLNSVGGDLTLVQSFTDQIRDEQIRKMTDSMTESVKTTRKDVAKVLEANAGKPVADVQAALQKKFTELTTSRAKMIATTTCKAQASVVQNQTVKRVNQREQDTKRKVVQVWLSQRDNLVRDTHVKLDGEWIEEGESFDKYVSGAGDGPGLGDASEAINCRCTLRPVRKSRITSDV